MLTVEIQDAVDAIVRSSSNADWDDAASRELALLRTFVRDVAQSGSTELRIKANVILTLYES